MGHRPQPQRHREPQLDNSRPQAGPAAGSRRRHNTFACSAPLPLRRICKHAARGARGSFSSAPVPAAGSWQLAAAAAGSSRQQQQQQQLAREGAGASREGQGGRGGGGAGRQAQPTGHDPLTWT
jgi:hypothetical protein